MQVRDVVVAGLWLIGGVLILHGVHEIAGNDATLVTLGLIIWKTVENYRKGIL